MRRHQGYKLFILLFYINSLLFSLESQADSPVTPEKNSNITSNEIEEGWVEKKIAPSTQWIESIFAPFTHWMEEEIQRKPDPEVVNTSSSSHSLISVQQAINIVLGKHQVKILRNQFKIGPPPYYKIKILSENGNVSTLNVHAFSGKIFSPEITKAQIEEAKP